MIALLLCLAHAGDPAGTLVDAITLELDRSAAELGLPDAPPLYSLRYQLVLLHEVDAKAEFGGLVRYREGPSNGLGVEVRVGTAEYDNTGFGGWQNGFVQAALPADLTPLAARLGAWRASDVAYKQAVEQYARKTSQFTAPDDHPGDYQQMPPVVGSRPIPGPSDGAALRDLTVSLSAVFADSSVPLLRGEVHLGHESGGLWTLDNAGSRVERPVEETTLRALAHSRTRDGMLLTDQRIWSVRQPKDLPDPEEMAAELAQMTDDLAALADAPVLDAEYVGPVIFEGQAAVDLFRYLLVGQLEGTPSEVPFDSWFGDLGEQKDPVRVGRRVLPPGWSATDDSERDPTHPSAFHWDLEGTPARRVELVSDGIVRDLLMSRVPRRGLEGSNGHARGWIGERASGRVSQLEVRAPRTQSSNALRKRAAKLAKAYDRDWFLVVERLQEPAVQMVGQGFAYYGSQTEGALPPPVSVTRVWRDGRTELLRGVAIVGVERWLLRDIVAAGPERRGTWMAATQALGSGLTSGLATLATAPDVLVGEVEIVPAPGDPRDATVLAPP